MCLELGFAHPDQLLEQLTSSQVGEWMAYYSLEPFGQERADLRAGIVAAAIQNCFSKRSRKPSEFMPRFDRDPEQDTADMRRQFQAFVRAAEKGR